MNRIRKPRSDMKAKWVLLIVCWSLLAVGCDDGDPCGGYKADYEALVAGAKACSADEDCQVFMVDCQMLGRLAEYVNLTLGVADLDSLIRAWREQECGGKGAYFCDGLVPPEPMCLEGQCGPAPDPFEACEEGGSADCEDVFACEKDSDCVKVPGECCPCNQGGVSTAINVCCIDTHEAILGCGPARRLCNQSQACNDLVPACEDGQCVLVEPGVDDS